MGSLGRFRQANLKLKPEKCFLASSEVLYLGYVVSREGISADVQKVEAVRSFPRPTNLTSLHSFLAWHPTIDDLYQSFQQWLVLFMHLHERMQNFLGAV